MKRVILLSVFIVLLSFVHGYSQTTNDTIEIGVNDTSYSIQELKGLVVDFNQEIALPYTNIYVLHKDMGTISNEKGHFSINIANLDKTDTLRFQYIGYKTRNITLGELDTTSVIYLKEDIINLSELLVFASDPDPVAIVKKVLKHKDSNYRKTTSKKLCFIRDRDIADIEEIILTYKKSSINNLDRETIALAEEKIPRNYTSYTDFLGNLYFNKNTEDSITLKVDPIRAVSLKEKDITELDQIASIFKDAIADTKEDEYWKVKTGIFSQKLDKDDLAEASENDTLDDNKQKLSYYRYSIKYKLSYSSMTDKDAWEFLYGTGKYNYTLAGGTRVNGEDVYIIDFTPKKSGLYIGRMFIAINTFALIRADYEYVPGKTGTDFHLLGVGYTENHFSGSIYFEKKNDNYVLKYFSKKAGAFASFDRSLALLKKKERFLFDKKLKEIKIGVELKVNMEESIELLVLDDTEISDQQFADFEQQKYMETIFVDQFNDNLWKDFSIIEPTTQMREYKKQEER